ncbi:sulfotransferase domain-containing protein [Streptomyces hoynatensis]|nr:sulfotransferase domain-containing protein [Streptomyces hoynatensis]
MIKGPERVYRSFFLDSTRWDDYEPRPGDIVVCTPPKAGTTWTQRIVSVLVFGDVGLPGPLGEVSPWLDGTFTPRGEVLRLLGAQRHRRFLKSHLPLDGLPFHSEVSYLVVARDPRDTAMSAHHHARGLNWLADLPPHGPPGTAAQPRVPEDAREFWRAYFTRGAFPWETNGWPYNSPTAHALSWWEWRREPNVCLLHYQELRDDLDGQMRRVAAFLGLAVDERRWPELVRACTFGRMRSERRRLLAGGVSGSALASFEFFHKGRNGQWREVAAEAELALYRAAVEPLPADLRDWLTRSA